ncbi:MAG: ATP-binding protein [Kiritimatiellia bacterium]
MTLFITVLSVALQLAAAFLAFRLIRVTGRRLAWLMVCLALTGMAVRRALSVLETVAGTHGSYDLAFELVGLLVSLLMLGGIALIGPIFRELRQSRESAAQNAEQVRLLLDSTAEGIFGLDTQGRCTFVNAAALRMLGYDDASGLIGRNPHAVFHHHRANGEPYPPEQCPFLAACVTGRPAHEASEVFWRADGTPLPVEYWAHPVEHAGRKEGAVVTFVDSTERRLWEEAIRHASETLEQRVKERTTQLEAVNKELEAFSYSVSHDLRAPLRAIDGFSQAVIEDYNDKLDDTGRDYLNRVRAASQRMSGLIDDMLQLSRLTRGDMVLEDVDLSAMAREIADELAAAEPARRVEFVIAPGLHARGDARLLRAVMQNLLDNAWKYTSKHSTARIEFGSETLKDGRTAYFVRDDGAGFDMTYAGKLFQPFQRLHAITEFPGNGIGLATIQRIIRRHGGEVWAEGAPERGAVFRFTLGE